MKVYDKLHCNDKEYSGGAKRYLYEYMAKNLFRFSGPLRSVSAYESSKERKIYIELYPVGYNPNNYELDKKIAFDYRDYYF